MKEERDKDNETSLTERGGIEMSTAVASIYAMHRSPFALLALSPSLFVFLLTNYA